MSTLPFSGAAAALGNVGGRLMPQWLDARRSKNALELEATLDSFLVNGYPLAVETAGAGAPLILIHGALSDYRNWQPQMAEFSKHFRVYAPSLRHCWPERWDGVGDGYSIPQHVADIVTFLAQLGEEKVCLVGHSRGGDVALQVAAAQPQRIERLVLAEPVPGRLDPDLAPQDPHAQDRPRSPIIAKAVQLIKSGDIEAGVQTFVEFSGGPGAWQKRSPERQGIARDNAYTLLGLASPPGPPIGKATLRTLSMPTLLVGGELTEPVFLDLLDLLERNIPGARRIAIANAAHGMNRDNPKQFNVDVLRFLVS